MFTNAKKDYYSINAKIALSPIIEQQQLQNMLQKEQQNSINMMNTVQEHSMHGGSVSNENESQENMMNQQQQNMYVIAQHLKNPVSTRYDDIYHPRTDKRVIRKLFDNQGRRALSAAESPIQARRLFL